MRLPSSLTSRLVVVAVGLVALISLLVGTTTYAVMREVLYDRLDQDVQAVAGGPQAIELRPLGLLVAYDEQGNVQHASYFSPSGRDLEPRTLTPRQVEPILDVPVDGQVHSVDLPQLGSFRVRTREGFAGPRGQEIPLTIVSGLPTDDVDRTLSSLVTWELLLGAIGVLVAFGGSLLLVRRTLAPLRDVASVAQDVTRLELDKGSVGETVRVPDRLTDERTEVGQVGASLNALLGHVEQALDARHRSEQQVRQFVADASHELRTPLTTIRGYAELAGRDPGVLPTSMAKVSDEAQRMSSLVDDLLLLARLDAGRSLASEPVDLSHLVVSAVDDARVVGPAHVWSLSLPPEPVLVDGDEQRLHEVVTNLLGNARRHTPSGTRVTAGLSASNGQVVLTVHDTGPGIPRGLDVYERFTRGDSSRTRASGGAGLGLSLVQAIVAAHGGAVSVESEPGDTTFTVTLPA